MLRERNASTVDLLKAAKSNGWSSAVVIVLTVATIAAVAQPAYAAPPANDTVAGATVISSLPFNAIQDTTEATLDADDESLQTVCPIAGDPTFTFSNSVWYAYTPSVDQTIMIETRSSDYNVAGAIVTGTVGAFSAVPGGCFLGSTTVDLTAGTTYYIDLLQFDAGSGGTLQLSVTEVITPEATVTVDPSGSFSKTGTATISGTATCTAGAFGFLGASLAQSVGRIATITGSADFGEITCDGTAQAWSITLTPNAGLFKGGKATASVFLSACGPIAFVCGFDQITREIKLKGAH